MKRNKQGELCPELQLIEDLDKLRDQAEEAGAGTVIMGDFNEKWKEKGPIQEWAINRGRLTNILQEEVGQVGTAHAGLRR